MRRYTSTETHMRKTPKTWTLAHPLPYDWRGFMRAIDAVRELPVQPLTPGGGALVRAAAAGELSGREFIMLLVASHDAPS